MGTAEIRRPAPGLPPELDRVFRDAGVIGADLAAVNWEATPLGPASGWPRSLLTMVRVLLTSRFSMWMAWGPELTFFCNDAYRRDTLGRKYPWALGRPAREVWAEIWPDIGPRIERVMSTGTATWDEALMLFLERSGYAEETYHTFSYSPLPDDDGQVSGMLCVVSEETERVIAERRMATLRDLGSEPVTVQDESAFLAAACRHLEANARSVPFALIYLFDDDGTARLAGRAGIEAGHPAAPAEIAPGDPQAAWPVHSVAAAGDLEVVDQIDERFADLPPGAWELPPHQAMLAPLDRQGHGRPYGVLVAAANRHRPLDENNRAFVGLIAQRIAAGLASARAYDAERRRSEALADLDRAKTAFFANVSHEFRTPLTLMLGPLQDALAESAGLTAGETALVHRNGLRLLKLVNALLEFSRIEAGRMRARFVPLDLPEATAELASTFRAATERGGVALEVECGVLSERVYVDPDLWERIVLNLLSNAFKFTLEGRIRVSVHEVDGEAEMVVADTGSGIAPGELDHLFERFHRAPITNARSHEGTGIGLALVKELVELHGGRIGVRSTEGEGSEFTVRLPLGRDHLPADQVSDDEVAPVAPGGAALFVQEALGWLDDGTPERPLELAEEVSGPEAAGRGGAAAAGPGARRPRVLVADDNADLRAYLVRLLSGQFEVEAVSDGLRALEVVGDEPPDLVITDVMMPGLDGFGLVSALRERVATREVPVIMLSARAGEEAAIEGLDAGADDYLPKPFSGRELLARARAHVDLSTLRRQTADELRAERARLSRLLRLLAVQRDILARVARGTPLPETLSSIVRGVEQLTGNGARASILLLSEDGRRLLHGAAPGLPPAYNEAIDGIEIGAAVGSCGTAAQRREVVIVTDIQSDPLWTDFRDLAAEHGLRSCWSTPIAATDGRLVGTFAIYHESPHDPGAEERELVELLSRSAAVAIERDRDARARARQLAELQSSLLPPSLPSVPGVGVAAGFHPGTRGLEVGGDFYDVFPLPSGAWGFLVGDVCGHGAEAAAVTATARHTARAIARRESGSASVLAAVDDALHESGHDRFCTAVYGRIEPASGGVHLCLANGGHPIPLIRRADGTIERLAGNGPLLGVVDDPEFPEVEAVLAPGDTLLLYTDGLVERNPRVGDDAGLEALVAGLHPGSAQEMLAELEAAALGPTPAMRDDVALLVLHAEG